jgi:hypothetical protein
MATITIAVSDERLIRLRERAAAAGLTPEEYVGQRLAPLLDQPSHEFQEAAEYVLRKNQELYRRLA